MKLSLNLPTINSRHRRSSTEAMNKTTYITDLSEKQSRARVLGILNSSHGKRPLSLNASVCVGNEAKLEFLDTYFHLPLISERNKIENVEDNPHVAYLEEIDKMHVKPQPFGIIRRKGPSNFIDIHMFSMGDAYAGAFSKGVKHYKIITNLNLKANRLSDNGCQKILSEIHSKKVKSINVSENKLGKKSITKIIDIISDHDNLLKTLELENISISERAISDLIKSLSDNKVLKNLNLAKNSLGFIACESLREMLRYNSSLVHLDLHWNSIRTEGATMLFEGLAQNDNLKVLDLSWNSLGRESSQEALKALGKCLKVNSTLKHLDISYNNLTLNDCEVFSVLIKENHDLIGLHVLGNEGFIDPQGFIIPTQQPPGIMQYGHFFNRILDKSKYSKHHHYSNNCWVCEKWVEMRFDWNSEDGNQEPTSIHLNTDNFLPTPLKKSKDGLGVTRVLPPGEVQFFWSNHMSAFTSKKFSVTTLKTPIPPSGTLKEVFTVNISPVVGDFCNLKYLFHSKARVDFSDPSIIKVEYEKIPWSLGISIFSNYSLETEELKTECFEFDWSYTKLTNLIKDEIIREQAKDLLRTKYDLVLEAYRTLSALSGSEAFAIGSNALNDFLNQGKVFDNYFTLSDMGITWNSTNSKSNQLNNSGTGLCRYEFLELIARVANDKYVRNKLAPNILDAIDKIFNEHLGGILEKYDCSKWRTEVYMTEEIDYTLRAHRTLLEHIYKKYSNQEQVPGQKPSMNLSEFRNLCMSSGIVNDQFTSREIDICFSRSMMLQSDNINKTRHLEMSFTEFLEAISRAANELNGPDLKPKLESIFPKLLHICSPAFKQTYSFPTEETYFNLMYKVKGS